MSDSGSPVPLLTSEASTLRREQHYEADQSAAESESGSGSSSTRDKEGSKLFPLPLSKYTRVPRSRRSSSS